MQAEDGVADTIRPRFNAAGGDPRRLLLLRGKRADKSEHEDAVTLQDIEVLETVLMTQQPALLIVDPLQAYLGANVDMHRANQTRPLLTALGRLAEQYQCAILCVRHLSKTRQDRTLYRGLGSIDFAAAARSVLLAGFDPDDPQRRRRVLGHSKSSLALQGPSLAYELRDDGFHWLGHSTVTVEQLLAPYQHEEALSEVDDAAGFLRSLLAEGALPAKDVLKEAQKAGIAERTLRRAKKHVGVKSWRENFVSDDRGRGLWVWGLQDGHGALTL